MDNLEKIIKGNIKKLNDWIKKETKDPDTPPERLDALDRNLDWQKKALLIHLLWQQDLIGEKIIPKGIPKDMEKELLKQGYRKK